MTGTLMVILLGGAPMAPPVQARPEVVLCPAIVVNAPGMLGLPEPRPATDEPAKGIEDDRPAPFTLGRAIVARSTGTRN
jgi:hypothetical protein